MTRFDPEFYLRAARVPVDLHPQRFGLWTIERRLAPTPDHFVAARVELLGSLSYTLLRHWRAVQPSEDDPYAGEVSCGFTNEIVMEDSRRELRQHLPIWRAGRGRVLVTGLGLGCVVRGLLASDRVDHIDVVEIDPEILSVIGPEFEHDPRVTLHLGDALTFKWPPGTRWDVAWHDLWTDGPDHLQLLHVRLMH